jgi:hypothetical protein
MLNKRGKMKPTAHATIPSSYSRKVWRKARREKLSEHKQVIAYMRLVVKPELPEDEAAQ